MIIKNYNKNPDMMELVIIGAGEFAEIAYHYFLRHSNYKISGFSAEGKFIAKNSLFGKPVVPFEEIEKYFPPETHKVFVAVTYTQLNRIRTKLYLAAKQKGYQFATFIHPTVHFDNTAVIGENCFIFEFNNIQYHVNIGNNVVLWSSNHIGHRTVIKDNVYISTGIVISGYCEIGESCFLGVNSSFNDYVKTGNDCIIGNGTIVTKNLEAGKVYVGNPAKSLVKSSYEAFNVQKI